MNRNASSMRKRGVPPPVPRLGRNQSGAARGLHSLRFLDTKTAGKEGDTWKGVEKRFGQFAIDGRLPREKFGVCVGNVFLLYFHFNTEIFNIVDFGSERFNAIKNASGN